MKRIERFVLWFKNKTTIGKILLAICVVAGMAMGAWSFVTIDKTTASNADYEMLEKMALDMEKNPDLLLRSGNKVEKENETIIVTLENSDCKVIATYNQKYELISISRRDKCTPVWIALVQAVGITIAAAVIIYCIILAMFIMIALCVTINEPSQSKFHNRI